MLTVVFTCMDLCEWLYVLHILWLLRCAILHKMKISNYNWHITSGWFGWVGREGVFLNMNIRKGYIPETLNYILELEKARRSLFLGSPTFIGGLRSGWWGKWGASLCSSPSPPIYLIQSQLLILEKDHIPLQWSPTPHPPWVSSWNPGKCHGIVLYIRHRERFSKAYLFTYLLPSENSLPEPQLMGTTKIPDVNYLHSFTGFAWLHPPFIIL